MFCFVTIIFELQLTELQTLLRRSKNLKIKCEKLLTAIISL